MNKYLRAAAPRIYLTISSEALASKYDMDNFVFEGREHPCCVLLTPTVEIIEAQACIVDKEDADTGTMMRNGLKRASLLIDYFEGDFSIYSEPFIMNWPSIEKPSSLGDRAELLSHLTVEDYKTIQEAQAALYPSDEDDAEKN